MKRIPLPGELFAFTTITLWASNALISEHLKSVAPIEISFFRWLLAFVCLFPLTFKNIKKHKNTLMRHWKFFGGLAVCLAIENAFFYRAGHTTDAVNISLFSSSMPLFLLLFEALFMKSALTLSQIAGVLLAALSVLYAILHGDFRRLADLSFKIGDIYALCSVFCLSLYTFLQRRRTAAISDLTFLTLLSGGIAILNFPAFICHELQTGNIFTFTHTDIIVLLYLGIGISFISYLCWEIAAKKIGPLKTGFIHYFSIPITALLNFLVMGIPISPFQILSCGGLIFSSLLMRKKVIKKAS